VLVVALVELPDEVVDLELSLGMLDDDANVKASDLKYSAALSNASAICCESCWR
jgi:hypothetical protein